MSISSKGVSAQSYSNKCECKLKLKLQQGEDVVVMHGWGCNHSDMLSIFLAEIGLDNGGTIDISQKSMYHKV
jgi:hypothetical protein